MTLVTENLTVRYGRRVAVDRVSLRAEPGEVLAVLGANGSGKSSLLRAVAGVQRHEGAVTLSRGPAAYMPQDNAAGAALTAFEVVLLGRLRSLALRVGAADLQAAQASLAELGVSHLAGRKIGQLSGGQRQLVFMAQVLAADPAVLLLDEPTSALDIAHQLQVLSLLRATTARRGLVTIVVLHDLNAAARFADRVALMRGGRMLLAGSPDEVFMPAVLRDAYGVEVAVLPGPDQQPVVTPLRPFPDQTACYAGGPLLEPSAEGICR